MRTIIAGGRDLHDYTLLQKAVAACPWPITFVVAGGATGVDAMAVRWAKEKGILCLEYMAQWQTHGKAAGPMRNRAMADDAQALLAIWDGRSKGTANMIETARAKGLKVCIFRVDLLPAAVEDDWI